jgi:cobalt-zinc-cadmium efflux system membrane fusion protein
MRYKKFKIMNNIVKLLILSAVLNSACSSNNQEVAEAIKTDPAIDNENIVFTKISKQLITDVVECTGKIDVPPDQRAAIHAPIGTMVKGIKVLPGDQVSKGQILFTMVHQDLVKIQQEYLQAKSTHQLLQVNLERKQKLFEAGSTSERELRTAQHDFNIGEANYESLKSQLLIIGISPKRLASKGITTEVNFLAPITGHISDVFAVSGSYVDVNSPILTIVDTDHKHVELEVYADKINLIRQGQDVEFRTPGSDIEYRAEILLVGREVHSDTRTVIVHAHLLDESANDLVIGSYLYAGIMISSDSVYSLPVTAIVMIENKNYVLVRSGTKLNPVEVTLGKSFKEFVEIKNFAELLDKEIVADDAYYLIE